MPKYTVLGHFGAERVAEVVPPDYRTLTRMAVRPGETYTVVLFAHDRAHGGVVTSAVVRRAVRRVRADHSLLAVGADFTREAADLLADHHATVVRIGEFGWTDESYHSNRG